MCQNKRMSAIELIEVPGTPYSYEPVLESTLDALSDRVDQMRRRGTLTPEVLHHLRRHFRIKNIYHSNAIEGNVLDVGETRQVVEMGLTITGKPLKDQAEAKNLSEALDFLEGLALHTASPIREYAIRQLHQFVLKGIDDDNAGAYRKVTVEISGSHYKPPGPETVPADMQAFADWLSDASEPSTMSEARKSALINAVAAHAWLVYVHPFIDGNGRVARLLMNLMLMRQGFPIAIVTREDRLRYYDALEVSQASDLSPFLALIVECVEESLEEYEMAVAEQRETEEWARSLSNKLDAKGKVRETNKYELWLNAMELLKSYTKQIAGIIDESGSFSSVYFKDFGNLAFEKYLSLRKGESAKRTWFFRVDFQTLHKDARYLFFFGFPSHHLPNGCEVSLHIAREEPPGSYHYERLENIVAENIPNLREIAYDPDRERFVARDLRGCREVKIEHMMRSFVDDIVNHHFSG